MRRKRVIPAVAALLVVATAAVAYGYGVEWTLVNWKVRHDFPSVARIDPKQVADWLNDPKRPQPVLLDVRTRPEYEVSHLHGAQQVDPDASAEAIKILRDKPIVTYCSVGYRSGAFAKKLQDAGYKNVQNMSGSIFEWANEGHPVERNGRQVDKVHPYNAKWGKLLKPSLRAQVPAAGAGM
ncbi:MAG: rhodanese-like domain-containing protein [Chthoniobacterales bacterium]